MNNRKSKKRKAWLITWESSREDYLADLKRPRIVAILNSRVAFKTIKIILSALYASESRLTFSQKIWFSFPPRNSELFRKEMQSICFGENPWLRAQIVSELYVQTCEESDEQEILYWTEGSFTQEDVENGTYESFPSRQTSEAVDFRQLWNYNNAYDENST